MFFHTVTRMIATRARFGSPRKLTPEAPRNSRRLLTSPRSVPSTARHTTAATTSEETTGMNSMERTMRPKRLRKRQIGRASCRERVESAVGGGDVKERGGGGRGG